MFLSVATLFLVACGASAITLIHTGGVISSNPAVPLPPIVTRSAAAPKGRPVFTHIPQILETQRTQKNVHSKFNVAVPQPITRRKVVQDVHHSFVAKPYPVPKPYAVPHPVAVPHPYPVYHHEVEVQEPLQVVRHHQHTQRVHHFPLVKTADVVHHSVQPAIIAHV